MLVFACVAGGMALRLMFPNDIEYKSDEAWTFTHVQADRAGAPWPWTGLATSVGPPNPGFSLWVFVALARLFDVSTPPELARTVQILACVALIALVGFARWAIDEAHREPWYWAAALWAVNPLAIIFERKIWPPSVLLLPMIALVAAWWFRRNRACAFLWGLLGALMAQIHLGVAFLAVAIAVWTWWRDGAAVRWGAWLAGGLVGSLPALPWLFELLTMSKGAALHWRWPFPSFYTRWVTQPFGLGVEYTLGWNHMRDFLSGPAVAGHPTYLIAALHIGLAVLLVLALARAIRAAMERRRFWTMVFLRGPDPSQTLMGAALWGYGLMLTALTMIGAGSHRHYLIVVAPLMALWTARIILDGDRTGSSAVGRRIILPLSCVLQLAVSAGLLGYIHQVQVIRGEYGATWQSQERSGISVGP
ncbi:MAG TPA: hypothetical protein VH684_07690 [Xanthobacteraceae bacterium]